MARRPVPRPAATARVCHAVAACLASAPLAAQATGSLGVGASVIRYEGFLTSGAVVLLPAVRFDSPRVSVAGQGNLTVFESGNEVVQGNVAAAWLAGSARRWRMELSASGGASRYASEPGSGHVLGGGRFHVFGERSGGWLGVTAGRTYGSGGATPVELALAGWTLSGRLALVGTVATTWIDADQYVDVLGALRWTGSAVELEARLGARPWTRSGGAVGDAVATAYADVTAHVALVDRLALSLGGGAYPSDPARRVLGATYFNVGLRLRAFGRAAASDPRLDAGLLRRLEADGRSDGAAARLEIAAAGERHIIRVRASGARSVEVMGDFTDWSPVALAAVAPGVWEVALALAPGTYRLNVRIDGGTWIAPAGTRVEANEFGGEAGIVVVP